MALERVPSDIRKEGGVARMASIRIIQEIMETVSIPVMAKARIGHFTEARVLEALGVDYIDESEVLTPADEEHHINKRDYKVPFVCGARNLGEALRRIAEGAAMIRTKGEAGSGNIVEAVRHIRAIVKEMKQLTVLGERRAGARVEESGRAARAGRVGGGQRQAAGAEFLGGRDCHAGRCRAGHAAWAPRRCSSAAGFSSPKTPRSAPARSSKPRLITTTRSSCSKPARNWARPCAAWMFRSSPKGNCCKPAAGNAQKTVGILALQGDFEAHRKAIEQAAAKAIEVRTAAELEPCDGLIIPGGESTTMLKLLERKG